MAEAAGAPGSVDAALVGPHAQQLLGCSVDWLREVVQRLQTAAGAGSGASAGTLHSLISLANNCLNLAGLARCWPAYLSSLSGDAYRALLALASELPAALPLEAPPEAPPHELTNTHLVGVRVRACCAAAAAAGLRGCAGSVGCRQQGAPSGVGLLHTTRLHALPCSQLPLLAAGLLAPGPDGRPEGTAEHQSWVVARVDEAAQRAGQRPEQLIAWLLGCLPAAARVMRWAADDPDARLLPPPDGQQRLAAVVQNWGGAISDVCGLGTHRTLRDPALVARWAEAAGAALRLLPCLAGLHVRWTAPRAPPGSVPLVPASRTAAASTASFCILLWADAATAAAAFAQGNLDPAAAAQLHPALAALHTAACRLAHWVAARASQAQLQTTPELASRPTLAAHLDRVYGALAAAQAAAEPPVPLRCAMCTMLADACCQPAAPVRAGWPGGREGGRVARMDGWMPHRSPSPPLPPASRWPAGSGRRRPRRTGARWPRCSGRCCWMAQGCLEWPGSPPSPRPWRSMPRRAPLQCRACAATCACQRC